MSEETPQDLPGNDRHKRKRKKSFLKNARKYAKKGYYGRGSKLDADTYGYFVRIMETYRAGFDSEEDKLIFANNVFEQTIDEEINCCCNQVGCRVVEELLPFANEEVLERFIKSFSEDMRPLIADRFASHVLEALVTQTCIRSLKTDTGSEEFRAKCHNFTIKVSKFLLNNLEDYVWDTYGNHVIRTCLENLAQIPKESPKQNVRKYPVKDVKQEDADVKTELPEDYVTIVKECGERLLLWPQFQTLCESDLTSSFLQVVLQALRKVDKKLLKKYLEKLISDSFAPEHGQEVDPNILPPIFLSLPSMRLLETALQVAKSKMFTQLYAKCFAGRLLKLAVTRNTNFSVQKLISNTREKVEFEAMFEELKDNFSPIIEAGHTGIILSLGQGCLKFSTQQGAFVQSLMKSLDCLEPEERQNHFVICLSKFKPYSLIQNQSSENLQKDKLNLHGTLLLQLILEFNKPIKIVNSILSMDTNDLKCLFANTMGSHIVDSYVSSTFVGEKSREKLVRKMKGVYQELASTKYGSRSFEALWNAANLKFKIQIMEELSYKDALWSNSEYGKIIAGKVNLTLFKRNKEDWKNSVNTSGKVKDLLSILK